MINWFYDLPVDLQRYIMKISYTLELIDNYKYISIKYKQVETVRYWYKIYYKKIFLNSNHIFQNWLNLLERTINIQLSGIHLHNNTFNVINWELYLKYILYRKGIEYKFNTFLYFNKKEYTELIKLDISTLQSRLFRSKCLIYNYNSIINNIDIDLNILVKCIFQGI